MFRGSAARRALKIKDHAGRAVVEGLKEVELPDLSTAREVMHMGWHHRQVANNGINGGSSRSHAVVCLTLLCTPPCQLVPTATRLHLVRCMSR